jgi:hypothetical protein
MIFHNVVVIREMSSKLYTLFQIAVVFQVDREERNDDSSLLAL